MTRSERRLLRKTFTSNNADAFFGLQAPLLLCHKSINPAEKAWLCPLLVSGLGLTRKRGTRISCATKHGKPSDALSSILRNTSGRGMGIGLYGSMVGKIAANDVASFPRNWPIRVIDTPTTNARSFSMPNELAMHERLEFGVSACSVCKPAF